MSFSVIVRRELAKINVEKNCCAIAELNGAVLASGGLSFRGAGRYGLSITVDSMTSCSRFRSMFYKFFGIECMMTQLETARLGGITRYSLFVPDDNATRIAGALDLLDENEPFGMRPAPSEATIEAEHCKKSFLRGAYIVAGAAGDPEKGYHLELDAPDQRLAKCLMDSFLYFGVNAKCAERKQRHVVYIKDGEHMANALAVLGAFKALMEFENTRIIRDCRNEANRLVNCDNANLDKAIAAAARQISMIETIARRSGLDGLPEPLRELAVARVKLPYASLAELGQALTPPIGKSGVNARMRKLQSIAEELVND